MFLIMGRTIIMCELFALCYRQIIITGLGAAYIKEISSPTCS